MVSETNKRIMKVSFVLVFTMLAILFLYSPYYQATITNFAIKDINELDFAKEGLWTTVYGNYLDGSALYSNQPGSSLSVEFEGHVISLALKVGPSAGVIRVYLDNNVTVYDLYSKDEVLIKRDIGTDLGLGVHKLKIALINTQNKLSADRNLVIDAILIDKPVKDWVRGVNGSIPELKSDNILLLAGENLIENFNSKFIEFFRELNVNVSKENVAPMSVVDILTNRSYNNLRDGPLSFFIVFLVLSFLLIISRNSVINSEPEINKIFDKFIRFIEIILRFCKLWVKPLMDKVFSISELIYLIVRPAIQQSILDFKVLFGFLSFLLVKVIRGAYKYIRRDMFRLKRNTVKTVENKKEDFKYNVKDIKINVKKLIPKINIPEVQTCKALGGFAVFSRISELFRSIFIWSNLISNKVIIILKESGGFVVSIFSQILVQIKDIKDKIVNLILDLFRRYKRLANRTFEPIKDIKPAHHEGRNIISEYLIGLNNKLEEKFDNIESGIKLQKIKSTTLFKVSPKVSNIKIKVKTEIINIVKETSSMLNKKIERLDTSIDNLEKGIKFQPVRPLITINRERNSNIKQKPERFTKQFENKERFGGLFLDEIDSKIQKVDKINLSQIRPEIDRGDYKIKTNPKLEIKLRKIQDDIYKRIEVLDSCIDEIDFKIKEIKLLNEPEKTFFQKFRERLF